MPIFRIYLISEQTHFRRIYFRPNRIHSRMFHGNVAKTCPRPDRGMGKNVAKRTHLGLGVRRRSAFRDMPEAYRETRHLSFVLIFMSRQPPRGGGPLPRFAGWGRHKI